MTLSENQKGVALMIVATLAFATTDTAFQMISGDIAVAQYLFIRGIILSGGIFFIAKSTKKPFPRDAGVRRKMLARGVAELGLAVSFLTALTHFPISTSTAILQTVPLVMTILGYFLFKERFGIIRGLAILCGFFGVLLIIKPGVVELSPYTILLPLSVFFITMRDLISHSLPKDVPSAWAAFVTVVMVAAASGAIAFSTGWKPVSSQTLSIVVILGLVSIMSQILIISAMRHGDISFVAPFRYSAILFAVFVDLFIFSRALDGLTILGCFMIAAAGALVLYREGQRKLKRAPKSQVQAHHN